MGIVSQRRKRERLRRMRKRLMIAAGVLLLCALSMSPQLKEQIAQIGRESLAVFEQSVQAELTLPQREIFALQLGVFDDGERAEADAQRLRREGVRCVVWQRERMRIVSAVALSRERLDMSAAGKNDAYVIKDVLQKTTLRIQAGSERMESVRQLLETPDYVLMHLLTGEKALEELVKKTLEIAKKEIDMHPEHALYTQLAQSLINWCALMEQMIPEADETTARNYAAVTMCTLCRELRLALHAQESAASMASAQRTPSTAADVMPPA